MLSPGSPPGGGGEEEEEEEEAAAMLAPPPPHGEGEGLAAAAILSPRRPHGEEEEAATAAAILSPRSGEEEEEAAAMLAPRSGEAVTPAAILSLRHSHNKEATPAAILSPCSGEAVTPAAILSPRPGEEEEEVTLSAILSPHHSHNEEATPSAILSPRPAEEEEEEEEEEEAPPSAILSPRPAEEEEEEEEEEAPPSAILSPPCPPGSEEEEAAAVRAAMSSAGWRRGGEEDVTAAGWRGRRKHVFVLSEAGKPIYSRHGNEEALAATMGVMMALVSFIQSGGNAIRAIRSEDRTLVFEQRGPLLLVSVSRTRQSAAQLRRELAFVHEQILSLLTRGGIARVFARRRGYDLRRLLAGAEAVLDRLLSGAAADGRLLLGAARCLPLPSPLRRTLSAALRRAAAAAAPAPALAILATGGRLVTAARQRALAEGGRLCASDLHLLLNLLGSGVGAGEVWTPVCLPRFNPDGYFYAYAATLGEEEDGGGGGGGGVTLILLSTEREGFYAAAGCRRRLEETLRAQGCWGELGAAVRGGAGYGPARPGAPELRHFLYKPLEGPEEMQQLPQFTSPELEDPYASEEEQQRLFDLYHYLHSRVHSPRRPLRLLYHVAEKETLLAWVTSKFELYGCFSPLVTKAGAIGVLTKLLRWLKKEEDWLFIRYPPPYCAAPARPEGAEAEG